MEGSEVSEAKRLRALEEENSWLKRSVADQAVQIHILKEVNAKKWPARPHDDGPRRSSVQDGLGKVAAACRALGLSEIEFNSHRSGPSSLQSRRIRKESARAKREASSLPGFRRITALMRRRMGSRSMGNASRGSERGRNQGEQETAAHSSVLRHLNGRAASGLSGRARFLELGICDRPD